jgi:antitoxin component YwqK of YwqJK toxin-antitoxin module
MDNSKYYANGQLNNGIINEYFKDDSLCFEGEYRDDKKIGEWKIFDEDGNLTKTQKYKG